jgi:hypothetical protein
MATQVLTDVPAADVDQVVATFKAEGATTVTKELQPNGKYKVTATFP